MSFLQSQHIWIGCGPTDCAGFVLHEGTLTVCSGGRYLNLGDIHMGGKGGKWNGIYARFSARWKANKPKATCDTNISWCIIFSFFHSSSVQTFFSFISTMFSVHDSLQLLTIQLYIYTDFYIYLHRQAQYSSYMCISTINWWVIKLIATTKRNCAKISVLEYWLSGITCI